MKMFDFEGSGGSKICNFCVRIGSERKKNTNGSKKVVAEGFRKKIDGKWRAGSFEDATGVVFWGGVAPPSSIEKRNTKNEVRRTKCEVRSSWDLTRHLGMANLCD